MRICVISMYFPWLTKKKKNKGKKEYIDLKLSGLRCFSFSFFTVF